MNNDYSKLIEYLDEKFTTSHADLEELSGKFDNLQSAVDNYAKRADTYFQEMVMLGHKVDRHENGYSKLLKRLG